MILGYKKKTTKKDNISWTKELRFSFYSLIWYENFSRYNFFLPIVDERQPLLDIFLIYSRSPFLSAHKEAKWRCSFSPHSCTSNINKPLKPSVTFTLNYCVIWLQAIHKNLG